jgi:hypothetical protein
MIKWSIFAAFFLCLCLILYDCHSEPSEGNIFWFPENPKYGYLEQIDTQKEKGHHYNFIKSDDSSKFIILGSFSALYPPKLCDTNAASFISSYNLDSNMLVVAYLNKKIHYDTVLIFPQRNLRDRNVKSTQDIRIHNISNYLFYLRDSTLFSIPLSIRRSILQIWRIKPDNRYDLKDVIIESDLPSMAGDFSQALFVPYSGMPVINSEMKDITRIWAYDFKSAERMVIREVVGRCFNPKRRTLTEPLYCCTIEGKYPNLVYNVCIIDDSIPRPLAKSKWPGEIDQYYLYQDSITVNTVNACDRDDRKTHAIFE